MQARTHAENDPKSSTKSTKKVKGWFDEGGPLKSWGPFVALTLFNLGLIAYSVPLAYAIVGLCTLAGIALVGAAPIIITKLLVLGAAIGLTFATYYAARAIYRKLSAHYQSEAEQINAQNASINSSDIDIQRRLSEGRDNEMVKVQSEGLSFSDPSLTDRAQPQLFSPKMNTEEGQGFFSRLFLFFFSRNLATQPVAGAAQSAVVEQTPERPSVS